MFSKSLDLGSVIRQLKTFSDAETNFYLEEYSQGEEDVAFNNVDMASYMIGLIIGSHLTLPTAPVTLPAAHFSTQHGQSVRNVLSQINEGTIVNISQAYSAASEMYEIRYKIAFEANKSLDMLLGIARQGVASGKAKYMNALTLMSKHPQLTGLYSTLNTEIALNTVKGPDA